MTMAVITMKRHTVLSLSHRALECSAQIEGADFAGAGRADGTRGKFMSAKLARLRTWPFASAGSRGFPPAAASLGKQRRGNRCICMSCTHSTHTRRHRRLDLDRDIKNIAGGAGS